MAGKPRAAQLDMTTIVPPGTLVPYAGSSAPDGWLLADGTTGLNSVTDTTLADLFAVIGTTYGGTGAADFDLPDMRGRVPLGVGTGDASDATAHALADKEGTETHTLVEGEMPAHTHGPGSGVEFQNKDSPGADGFAGGGDLLTGISSGATASTGGGGAHNNLQPSLTLTFIIKK